MAVFPTYWVPTRQRLSSGDTATVPLTGLFHSGTLVLGGQFSGTASFTSDVANSGSFSSQSLVIAPGVGSSSSTTIPSTWIIPSGISNLRITFAGSGVLEVNAFVEFFSDTTSTGSSGYISFPLTHVSTRYYPGIHISSGTTLLVQGEMRLCPFWVPVTGTYDRIVAESTIVSEAGGVMRMGVYGADQSTGFPTGAPLVDAGTVAVDVGTGMKEITINTSLPAGLVWLAAVSQLTPTTGVTTRTTVPFVAPIASAAASSAAFAGSGGIWIQGSVTGALPTWAGNPGSQTVYTKMYLRKA